MIGQISFKKFDERFILNRILRILKKLINANNEEVLSELIFLLENIEKSEDIINCIKILGKLEFRDKEIFKLLENYLKSEKHEKVKLVSAEYLIQEFPDESFKPLLWTFQNDKSEELLIKILKFCKNVNYKNLDALYSTFINRITSILGISQEDIKFLGILLNMIIWDFNWFLFFYEILGRLKIKQNHIISLDLSGLKITKLPNFNEIPIYLENLNLKNNVLKTIPNWVRLISRRNYRQKYIEEGVNEKEATALGLLEILTGFELKKLKKDENVSLNTDSLGYKLNDKGNVIAIGSENHNVYQAGILPEDLFTLEFLNELTVPKSSIKIIPDKVCNLKFLKEISICCAKIKYIPENFTKLIDLVNINLSANRIREIPESIANLQSLEKLDLSGNRIQTIPNSIGKLNSLKILKLNANKICKLPEAIFKLQSLEHLELAYNYLRIIPESIGNLRSLEVLNLTYNEIEELPKSFENLQSLKAIFLRGNNFDKIPEVLIKLKSLKTIRF